MNLRTCTQCGQENRIPWARLADRARCGQCKAMIGPLNKPLDVSAADFDEITRLAKVPVLVDFWAEWCGPCRMAAPHVERIAQELAGQALVLKVNTDRQPALANRFQVRGIPHFVVLSGGQVVSQQSGLADHAQLRRWLLAAA